MKIPKKAKRVFKGKIFDVYHWEQEMFDGSTETFERLRRPNTSEVIAVKGDKICLSFQSQPGRENFYSLYGGRFNEGETAVEAVKRELLEESGMISDSFELYKSYEPIGKIDWTIYLFIAKDCKKVKDPELESGEKIKPIEMSFDEFVDCVLSDNFRDNELTTEVLKMKVAGTLEDFRTKLLG
jgi:ADP-ribose pyrophosphatase